MKKIIVLVLLLVGIGVVYSGFAKHKLIATADSELKKVDAILSKSNPVYTLTLSSNPTTGYSWFLLSYDHDLLTLDSHKYVPAKTGKMIMGSGGHEIWEFTATDNALIAPHITTIKLVYARPWELKSGKPMNKKDIKKIIVITH